MQAIASSLDASAAYKYAVYPDPLYFQLLRKLQQQVEMLSSCAMAMRATNGRTIGGSPEPYFIMKLGDGYRGAVK